jgi:hypothetical protein
MLVLFWCHVVSYVDAIVSVIHAVSIFRAEVTKLASEGLTQNIGTKLQNYMVPKPKTTPTYELLRKLQISCTSTF